MPSHGTNAPGATYNVKERARFGRLSCKPAEEVLAVAWEFSEGTCFRVSRF